MNRRLLHPSMSPKTIGILGFDGVSASHLTATADVFAHAALDDGFGGRIPCYQVWLLGLTIKPFATEAGLLFHPAKSMSDAPALDSVIVPGGRGVRPASDLLAEFVLSRACETRRMASICTGLYALAATGLLHGREATTHWRAAPDLQRSYPDLRVDHRRRLVKDGPFYSCAGLTAGVDLALAMVEEDYGRQVALAVRRDLMLYLAEPSSSGPLPRAQQAEEGPIDRFGDLVAWIMRHLHQPLTVEAMARRAGMCPAHFTRAFKSVFGQAPGEFVENLRLNEARRRLASRGKTLRSVAASVGFRNPESFRRAFERRFGTAPRTYLNGNKSRPAAIAAPPRR